MSNSNNDNVTVISEYSPSNYKSTGLAFDLTIKLKRNTSSGWGSSTIVPAQGEPCAEILSDGRIRFKIGDGTNQWANLPYAVCAVDDGELI